MAEQLNGPPSERPVRVETVYYIPEAATGRAMAVRAGLTMILGGLDLIEKAAGYPGTFSHLDVPDERGES